MANPRATPLSTRKRLFMLAGVLLCTAVLLEGVLQLAAAASPRVRVLLSPAWSPLRRAAATPSVAPSMPDALLGHRPNSAYPGHDARGFRNPEAISTAAIVALGDSHTYGANVAPELTWTRRLAERCGESVYNMAFGGYGPAHALTLLPEALELKPRIILVGVYSGNDLYDCFNLINERKTHAELASDDPAVRARIAAAEAALPMKQKIDAIWQELYGDLLGPTEACASDALTDSSPDVPTGISFADCQPTEIPPFGPRRLVSEYSKLYGLARAAKDFVCDASVDEKRRTIQRWARAKKQAAGLPHQCVVFEVDGARTILTPRIRLAALDWDDPRIAEGFRVASRSLDEIRDQAAAAGARVVVVFLPTKEYVFENLVRESGQRIGSEYQHLIAAENRLWKEMRRELTAFGIECVDTVPALREALRAGRHPYPEDRDGHPSAAGHEVIAQVVFEALSAESSATSAREIDLGSP